MDEIEDTKASAEETPAETPVPHVSGGQTADTPPGTPGLQPGSLGRRA